MHTRETTVATSTRSDLRALDLDPTIDLRDHADPSLVATGVIDLSGRLRPTGSRRSSRHTHTRLIAALARINADSQGRADAAAALATAFPEDR